MFPYLLYSEPSHSNVVTSLRGTIKAHMKEEKNQKKILLQIPSLWRFNPVVLVLLP